MKEYPTPPPRQNLLATALAERFGERCANDAATFLQRLNTMHNAIKDGAEGEQLRGLACAFARQALDFEDGVHRAFMLNRVKRAAATAIREEATELSLGIQRGEVTPADAQTKLIALMAKVNRTVLG